MAINRTGNDANVTRTRGTGESTRSRRAGLGESMTGTTVTSANGGIAGSFNAELTTALNDIAGGLGGGGGGGSRALE